MAISQAQQDIDRAASRKARDERAASIMAQRKIAQGQMKIERDAIVKATGQDKRTVGRQLRDKAHQASLKRIYGKNLDTTNPAAVKAARAAKEASARQTRLDAKQVRNTQRAADLAIATKQAEKQNAADRVVQLQEGANRIAARDAQDNALSVAKSAAKSAGTMTSPTPKTTLPLPTSTSTSNPVASSKPVSTSASTPVASTSTGFSSMAASPVDTTQAPMKRGGSVKYTNRNNQAYVKSSRVSTHTPSKKAPNW